MYHVRMTCTYNPRVRLSERADHQLVLYIFHWLQIKPCCRLSNTEYMNPTRGPLQQLLTEPLQLHHVHFSPALDPVEDAPPALA